MNLITTNQQNTSVRNPETSSCTPGECKFLILSTVSGSKSLPTGTVPCSAFGKKSLTPIFSLGRERSKMYVHLPFRGASQTTRVCSAFIQILQEGWGQLGYLREQRHQPHTKVYSTSDRQKMEHQDCDLLQHHRSHNTIERQGEVGGRPE